jgi:hypothetical protein
VRSFLYLFQTLWNSVARYCEGKFGNRTGPSTPPYTPLFSYTPYPYFPTLSIFLCPLYSLYSLFSYTPYPYPYPYTPYTPYTPYFNTKHTPYSNTPDIPPIFQYYIFSYTSNSTKVVLLLFNFPIANGITTDSIKIVFFSLQSTANKTSPVSLRLIYHVGFLKLYTPFQFTLNMLQPYPQ